jgi:signal transduction histidine kinase/pSer/pThr/pTyr-binding forkhead associated (FHA) protein
VLTLRVLAGPDQGKSFDVREFPALIGRDTGNAVRLNDDMASRRHAELLFHDGRLILRDLLSTNGTFLNDELVSEVEFKGGDRIRVGKSILEVSETRTQTRPVEVKPPTSMTPPSKTVIRIAGQDTIAGEPPVGRSGGVEAMVAGVGAGDAGKLRQYLVTLYEVSGLISSTTEVNELLDKVLDAVFEKVQADQGFIMVLNEGSGQLELRVSRRRKGGPAATDFTISRTIINAVIEKGEPVLTADALADERFQRGQSIIAGNIRSAMCAPLRSRDKVIGLIQVHNEEGSRQFAEDDLHMLVAIGNAAGIALENARLFQTILRAERLAAVGGVVAGLSHYIKNILNGMQAGAMVVQMALQNRDMDALTKGWEIVRKNLNKVKDLVMDMLSYSKERKLQLEPVNPNDIVNDVVELLEAKAQGRGVRLTAALDERLGSVLLDPIGIHRVVLNLVSNALDAVRRDEGVIGIATRAVPPERALTIEVTDNGCGMSAAVLPHIFEAFFTTKGVEGTGLGLAITDRIVKEHGGTIAVTSQEGRGSTFTVRLPLRRAAEG